MSSYILISGYLYSSRFIHLGRHRRYNNYHIPHLPPLSALVAPLKDAFLLGEAHPWRVSDNDLLDHTSIPRVRRGIAAAQVVLVAEAHVRRYRLTAVLVVHRHLL